MNRERSVCALAQVSRDYPGCDCSALTIIGSHSSEAVSSSRIHRWDNASRHALRGPVRFVHCEFRIQLDGRTDTTPGLYSIRQASGTSMWQLLAITRTSVDELQDVFVSRPSVRLKAPPKSPPTCQAGAAQAGNDSTGRDYPDPSVPLESSARTREQRGSVAIAPRARAANSERETFVGELVVLRVESQPCPDGPPRSGAS